jgi:hypothetical protein
MISCSFGYRSSLNRTNVTKKQILVLGNMVLIGKKDYFGDKVASFLTRTVPPAGATTGAMASPPLVQCGKVSLPWKKLFQIASDSSVLLIWPTVYFCVGMNRNQRMKPGKELITIHPIHHNHVHCEHEKIIEDKRYLRH